MAVREGLLTLHVAVAIARPVARVTQATGHLCNLSRCTSLADTDSAVDSALVTAAIDTHSRAAREAGELAEICVALPSACAGVGVTAYIGTRVHRSLRAFGTATQTGPGS